MSSTIFLILRFAFTISLYIFIGWALYILWRDLKQQSTLLAKRKPTPLTLLLYAEEETKAFRFSVPEVIIGRDPTCNLPLDDNTVSAQHARLSYRQGQWWVEDLRSTNGTFLNQEAVSLPLVITNGDEVRFGQVLFNISIGDDDTSGSLSSGQV